MHFSTPSPPQYRLQSKLQPAVAPPFTSGFGAVMDQEEDIQSATHRCLGSDHGPNTVAIDRVLQDQGMRLGANIALLEQRYELLPHPSRFQALQTKHDGLSSAGRTTTGMSEALLPTLAGLHLKLLQKIETLIAHRPDGQRGELILTEIARNHEEMAGALIALLKDTDAVHDRIASPVIASAAPAVALSKSESNWENEGGGGAVAAPGPSGTDSRIPPATSLPL